MFALTRWSDSGINVGLSGGRGGGVAELLGTHSYQLDPKGRVSLPARFRAAFVDGCWITVGQDRCLYVFPRAEWQRRSDEVASSPLSDTDGRAYSRMFFGSSEEAKLDGQGRVTIRNACGRPSASTRTSLCSACGTGWRSGIARRTRATPRVSPTRTRPVRSIPGR